MLLCRFARTNFKKQRKEKHMVFGKHINRYYLKYLLPLLVGLLSLYFVDYLQLMIPTFYRTIINGINDGVVLHEGEMVDFTLDFVAREICLPMVGIIVALVIGRFLWRICLFGSGICVERDLRIRMFDHAKGLSHQFYQKNKVGDLMSLYTNDLETVQDCFGSGFLMLFDAILLGSMALTKMFRMNALLAALSLIPLLLLLLASTIVGKELTKRWDVRQEAFSRLSDRSQESFSGIAVIKAFVKEVKEIASFRKINDENEEANIRYTRTSVLMHILVTFFVESIICIILGYGGNLVYQEVFNAGQLIEFISYFVETIWPIMAVSELIDMTSRGRASLGRIGTLLDAEVDVTDRQDARPLPEVKGKIEFSHLTFTYPDSEIPALQDVSFVIEAGESVGIVGKTGAGKTTLVDLILRTFNVPDGTLFIDGEDVNSVRIADVRNACAYVPQDNFLFSDTIENNIAFADRTSAPERVEEAARLADIDSNIREFAQGYQTVLGERGVTVSGGQKQRISIARALLKESPILILDDSVSAVDTATEKTILENLRSTRKGRTTVMIAHRISTIQTLDKIVFIEDGRVLGVGHHSVLYNELAPYRKMVDLQRLEDAREGRANA